MADWTIEDIRERCVDVAKRYYDLDFDLPIYFNGRLTSTLGRVMFTRGIPCTPLKMEFSTQFFKTSSDNSIIGVIDHELAHWIAIKLTGENHGHDAFFKEICRTIGCENDGCKTGVERIVANEECYRYTCYCPECGFIAGYSRRTKTLQNISRCICTRCGGGGLYYKKNW